MCCGLDGSLFPYPNATPALQSNVTEPGSESEFGPPSNPLKLPTLTPAPYVSLVEGDQSALMFAFSDDELSGRGSGSTT